MPKSSAIASPITSSAGAEAVSLAREPVVRSSSPEPGLSSLWSGEPLVARAALISSSIWELARLRRETLIAEHPAENRIDVLQMIIRVEQPVDRPRRQIPDDLRISLQPVREAALAAPNGVPLGHRVA